MKGYELFGRFKETFGWTLLEGGLLTPWVGTLGEVDFGKKGGKRAGKGFHRKALDGKGFSKYLSWEISLPRFKQVLWKQFPKFVTWEDTLLFGDSLKKNPSFPLGINLV